MVGSCQVIMSKETGPDMETPNTLRGNAGNEEEVVPFPADKEVMGVVAPPAGSGAPAEN